MKGTALKRLIWVVRTRSTLKETFKDLRRSFPSGDVKWMDVAVAAAHRVLVLQHLRSQVIQVPGAMFQQALAFEIEERKNLHVVFPDRLEEQLKW